MSIIDWIVDWFTSNCDGDWEHENQIKIYTVSNPGWSVVIDLRDTPLENVNIEYYLIEKSDTDWYDGISVKDSVFNAAGDVSKFSFLLEKFVELAKQEKEKTRW